MNLLRIHRLVQLIGLLQAGKGHNADSLAAACQVSRRTIFRDLEVLRQAGVPLLFDEDQGRYCIPTTYFLPPTNFTPDEALAVVVLCYELGKQGHVPFAGPAQSAALKLESILPVSLRDYLRDASAAIQINMQPASSLEGKSALYKTLLDCIACRQAVRIHYRSLSEGDEIVTKLCPYRLLFSRHSWYVIGRSSLHREVRTFHLGRIQKLALPNERFELPRRFSLEHYLGNAWHMIPEPGPDQHVVVRFQPMVAHNVAEVIWHKTQRLTWNSDSTLDFGVMVSALREISWWILGYGDQAEVLKPQRLREMVAQRVARLANLYNGDCSTRS